MISAALKELDERESYYNSSFVVAQDGVCQHAHSQYDPSLFCSCCRPMVEEGMRRNRCSAKGKYLIRSSVGFYRDLVVCGTHKRMFVDKPIGWVAHHDWQVVAEDSIEGKIQYLKSLGYEVTKK